MSTARGLSDSDEGISSIIQLLIAGLSTSLHKTHRLLQKGLVSTLTNATLNSGRNVVCDKTTECKHIQVQRTLGRQAEDLSSLTFGKQKPFSGIRLENTFVLDTTMLQAQDSTLSTESNRLFSGSAVVKSSSRISIGFSKRTHRFLDKIKLLDASLLITFFKTISFSFTGRMLKYPSH